MYRRVESLNIPRGEEEKYVDSAVCVHVISKNVTCLLATESEVLPSHTAFLTVGNTVVPVKSDIVYCAREGELQ